MHAPDWHVSLVVQALASLHAAPFALLGFEHTPVTVSQTPGTWHWSAARHVTGLPPVQVPDWHWSVWVQAFPSLQAALLGLFGFEQTPVTMLHVPTLWH